MTVGERWMFRVLHAVPDDARLVGAMHIVALTPDLIRRDDSGISALRTAGGRHV